MQYSPADDEKRMDSLKELFPGVLSDVTEEYFPAVVGVVQTQPYAAIGRIHMNVAVKEMYIGEPYNLCINRGDTGQSLNVFHCEKSRLDPDTSTTVEVSKSWADQCLLLLTQIARIKDGLEPWISRPLTSDEIDDRDAQFQQSVNDAYLSATETERVGIIAARLETDHRHRNYLRTQGVRYASNDDGSPQPITDEMRREWMEKANSSVFVKLSHSFKKRYADKSYYTEEWEWKNYMNDLCRILRIPYSKEDLERAATY